MSSPLDDDMGGIPRPKERQMFRADAKDSIRSLSVKAKTRVVPHSGKGFSGIMNLSATRSSSSGNVSQASNGPRFPANTAVSCEMQSMSCNDNSTQLRTQTPDVFNLISPVFLSSHSWHSTYSSSESGFQVAQKGIPLKNCNAFALEQISGLGQASEDDKTHT